MTTTRTPPAWRRAFLRELARTGSVSRAAEACGFDRSYPYQARNRSAAFAASWDRALAAGQARLEAGAAVPENPVSAEPRPTLRADETIRNSRTGKTAIVRVGPNRWSSGKEAAFLAELTATANVKAAARAAGVTPSAVYLRRKHYPAFKAEWDAAVAEGFARIETLVVCAATTTLEPEPLPERAWEEPRMTMDQALKVWLTHRAGGPGARKQRLGGVARREPDIEEVRAEIMRKVAAIKRARGVAG